MLALLKRNFFIITIFIVTLSLAFITFLTFIGKSFIELNDNNLQNLLIFNFVLLIFFFILIFIDIRNSIKNNINVRGSVANRKYIISFALFTLIPSLLIAIFSLFIFSFALEKYFDQKITMAVNNSYEIAKNYLDEKRNKIESEIILIAFDLNKYSKLMNSNPKKFQSILNTQRVIRDIDQLHLIDGKGNLIQSASNSFYKRIEDRAIKMVLNDERPLKIINTFENKSAAVIKLTNYENIYLYVVKFIDKNISQYLIKSEEAVNFYYTVENQGLGIRISFVLIYISLVTLLLFLSITIAIRFSSRFFISINNLITASVSIGKGNLDTKVPEVKADKEMELLNKNFNLMIDKLKNQQKKLLTSERHEAWENVARKLAHEIKNPLTPIQLTIDNLKSKYLENIDESKKNKYQENLKTIQKQIKQIENLVNEFSDFARMPKPLIKKNNLYEVISENINLLNKIDPNIKIKLINHLSKNSYVNFDYEQFNRLFFNLIKNSIESIHEKSQKGYKIDKNIDIEIRGRRDYIIINLLDSGIGFKNKKTKDLIKPYFTTKEKGTGLGLSIVDKIISDHNGSINFINQENGAKIQIIIPNK
jgi:two-component system nitrogen regulation sensor histidine kinase NtrY